MRRSLLASACILPLLSVSALAGSMSLLGAGRSGVPLPSWVTSSPLYAAGFTMITDWRQPNGDGTYGQTWTAATNTVVPASTYFGHANSNPGTAYDLSGNPVQFATSTLRATNAGLTTEPTITNLFLNSQSPATQTIPTVNATVYTVWGLGTGTLVASGSGTGTATCGYPGTPLTFTASGTSLTVTPSGSCTYVMTAATAFAVTPIISAGTTQLRSADAVIAAAAPWLNSGGPGCMVDTFTAEGISAVTAVPAYVGDGTTSNRSYIAHVPTNFNVLVTSGGVGRTSLVSTQTVTANTLYKAASAWDTNDAGLAINGVAVTRSSATGANPALSQMNIGSQTTGASSVSAVHQVSGYKPSACTNTQLQALTQ